MTLGPDSRRKLNQIRDRRANLKVDTAVALHEAKSQHPTASLRELADAVGLSHTQVKRILEETSEHVTDVSV